MPAKKLKTTDIEIKEAGGAGKAGEINLGENLAKLAAIASWFDEQEEVDIEEGLAKVKDAAGLIKESRARLAAVENEFLEIRKEIEERNQ